MQRIFIILSFLMIFFLPAGLSAQKTFTGSDGVEVTINDMSRIVSIGTAVTETIFALDAAENVIAVDESSVYPEQTADILKVSFTRNLSAEGILSTSPTVILASGAAGPESTIRQIRGAGIPLLRVTADETVEGAFERVEQLGTVLNKEKRADEIIAGMKKDLSRAESARNELHDIPVVLFIYARGPNSLMVAGNKTSAKTVIELAGGKNAFSDFEGYKPLTAEAVVAVNPDIILMMDSGLQSVGGAANVPGVNLTNAAINERIYSMEGSYLLGFGPRMGQAVLDLMHLFHPEADIAER